MSEVPNGKPPTSYWIIAGIFLLYKCLLVQIKLKVVYLLLFN